MEILAVYGVAIITAMISVERVATLENRRSCSVKICFHFRTSSIFYTGPENGEKVLKEAKVQFYKEEARMVRMPCGTRGRFTR